MAYTYTLKDIIEITGVTKRTLHYYDEIGLLVPDKNDKNYRVYKQQDLEKLQKILILKSFEVKSRLLCKMLYNVFTISTYQN